MASFNLSPAVSRSSATVASITALKDGGFATTYVANNEIRVGFFEASGAGRVVRAGDTALSDVGLENLFLAHVMQDAEGRLFLDGVLLDQTLTKSELIAQPVLIDGQTIGDPIRLAGDGVSPTRLDPGRLLGVPDSLETAYLLFAQATPEAAETFSLALVVSEDGEPRLQTVEVERDEFTKIVWLDEGAALSIRDEGAGGVRLTDALGLDDDPASFVLPAGEIPEIGVGNRVLSVSSRSDGQRPVTTLRLFEAGVDAPVMETAFGGNEGLPPDYAVEIEGVGFAIAVVGEDRARVDVYDLDGDLLRSLPVNPNVGAGGGKSGNDPLVALTSADSIRLLTTFETSREVDGLPIDTLKGEVFDFAVELVLDGTAQEDILRGLKLADILRGQDGDDEISGGKGGDDLRGGDGADVLFAGGGDDIVFGEKGDDDLFGNAGADLLDGGRGDDAVTESAGANRLFGGEGNDNVRGGKDGDVIRGEEDDDRLFGADGDDTIEGGSGADTVSGGAGKDRLVVGDGSDEVRGGEGRDRIVVESVGEQADVTVADFRRGEDKLQLKGFDGAGDISDLTVLDAGDAIILTNGGDGDAFAVTLEGLNRFTASDVLFG